MCLAIPGLVLSITEIAPPLPGVQSPSSPITWLHRTGQVKFGGIIREVNLAYVPEAVVGNYVIVHVGFAIGIVKESEAMRVFEYLREMDELQELSINANDPTPMPAPTGDRP